MCSPIHSVDGVCKRVDGFCEGISILNRSLDAHSFHVLFNVHDRMQSVTVPVKVADKRGQPALEVEGELPASAFVLEEDRHATRYESHFAEALG